MEARSNQPPDAHLAWSPVLWFAPLLVVCAVVAAVLLTPLAGVDVPLDVPVTGFFRRRRHHFGPPRRYYHY